VTPDEREAYEDELEELLDFISGKGKYKGLGKGGISEPTSGNAEDARQHAMLAELERRGLAKQMRDATGFVWRATGLTIVRQDDE